MAVLVSIIIPITTRNSQLLYHLPGPPQMKTVETSLVIAHRARQFALLPSTITACNAHTIFNISIRIISANQIAPIGEGLKVLCRNWTAEGRWDGELPRQLIGPFRTNLALVVLNLPPPEALVALLFVPRQKPLEASLTHKLEMTPIQ